MHHVLITLGLVCAGCSWWRGHSAGLFHAVCCSCALAQPFPVVLNLDREHQHRGDVSVLSHSAIIFECLPKPKESVEAEERNLPFVFFFCLCLGFSIGSFENDMCTLRKGHRCITCGEFSTVLSIHRTSWTLSSSLKMLVNLVYWVKHVWKNFNQKESRSFTVILIKNVALVRYETFPLGHLFRCSLER